MTKDHHAEAQHVSIVAALSRTGATLRNGMVAANLPDLLEGVRSMVSHIRIEGGAVRQAEVAFRLRTSGNLQQFRIGAALAAALITDREIGPHLVTQKNAPAPWDTHPDQWGNFLSFIMRRAEDFLDLQFDNFGRSTAGPYLENIEINRRKEDSIYFDTKLGV